jgi:MtN3 and saliva related transmembrane protein
MRPGWLQDHFRPQCCFSPVVDKRLSGCFAEPVGRPSQRSCIEVLMLNLLGLLAAFCTTMAFVPQLVKVWRSRSANDISLGMFSLMTLGIALWLIYGIALLDLPLIVANAITLCLAASILVMKLKHG